MNFKPLYDKVICKELKRDLYNNDETVSGIFIPQTASDKPMLAEVVAAGDGILTANGDVIPLKVKVGDIVVFNTLSQSVNPFKDGIKEYILMRESDIWAVIDKETIGLQNQPNLMLMDDFIEDETEHAN
jgi:chaperonin GroES